MVCKRGPPERTDLGPVCATVDGARSSRDLAGAMAPLLQDRAVWRICSEERLAGKGGPPLTSFYAREAIGAWALLDARLGMPRSETHDVIRLPRPSSPCSPCSSPTPSPPRNSTKTHSTPPPVGGKTPWSRGGGLIGLTNSRPFGHHRCRGQRVTHWMMLFAPHVGRLCMFIPYHV